MTWRPIARREVGGLWRPRGIKVGLAAVALLFVLGGYVLPTSNPEPTTTDYAGYMTGAVTLVLPLVGLLLGYKTIVAERASGRMALLLSLPHSRKDAVVGKFVGRGAVLAGVVAVGVVGGTALTAYPFGSFDAGTMLSYLVVTLLYGLAFLGIGMAISTLTTSNRLATAAVFGVFFAFVVVWAQLRLPIRLALEYVDLLADGALPNWALFLHGLEPGMLYGRVLRGLFEGVDAGPYLGPDAPWYLGARPALALLVAWVVLPVTAGYLRFRGTDL